MRIISVQNPRVKAAVRLRNSRDRARQGCLVIDGVREIHRALDGGVKLLEVFVCPEMCGGEGARRLLDRLSGGDAEMFEATATVFAKLAYGQRAEGLVAVAEAPQRTLADLRLPAYRKTSPPLVAVLEGIEKPGNVGAVLRSADGAGVSAVIVADSGGDLYNPNALRASLGTIFTLPVCSATSIEALAWLRQQRLTIYAARVDGAVDYTACDFTRPCAVVLGSEAEGLSDVWRGDDMVPIRLPMHGAADSLNVSATAAVLFYEALRQRTIR